MSATGKPGVLVRGSCAAGHVTETHAEGRRVTWQGTCSTDGCDLPVSAKRVPGDRVPPPQQPDPDDNSGVTVARVDDWEDTSSGDRDDAGGFHVDDEHRPAELIDPKPEGDSPAVDDPLDEHGDDSTAWSRWRERRRAARSARRRAGYRHPLL